MNVSLIPEFIHPSSDHNAHLLLIAWAVEGVDLNWMLTVAVLASSHNVKSLDPIDKVTVTTLKDYPKAREMLQEGWTTHKFTPFDPVSKRITAEVERDGHKYVCAKGAPNAYVFHCIIMQQTGGS